MEHEKITQIVASVTKKLLESQNVTNISLDIADEIIKRVRKKAKEMGVNAVIAVANAAARPVAVACMDNSFVASYDIAFNKAFTSAALKMSTSELAKLCQPGASLYGIQFTNDGKIVIFGGGVPLYHNGVLIGALGVSGGTEEQDTVLAQYGTQILEEAITCLL